MSQHILGLMRRRVSELIIRRALFLTWLFHGVSLVCLSPNVSAIIHSESATVKIVILQVTTPHIRCSMDPPQFLACHHGE